MSLSVDLSLDRPDFALRVAFEAGPGVTALFGPSGAGKTTVARLVAGLERGGGPVRLDGERIDALPPDRRQIGYVFQEPRLMPHMDVRANLLLGAQPGTDPTEVARLLEIETLLPRRPRALSGGEAARVAIGRALLRGPRLLILDEPLAALDHRLKAQLLPHLERLRETGLPVLYISHAIEEVARLADTLVLLRNGRVERAGPLSEVLGDPTSATVLGPNAAGAVLTGRVGASSGGLCEVETEAGLLRLPATDVTVGSRVRIRLPASDVIVAVEKPTGLSALNILPARIEVLHEGEGPGVMLGLRAGTARLLARVTRVSAQALDLAPGREVWVVVKATGVSRANVG
ncbi:molybdenum ABC transporter ATP-binding protein [Jannaschia aquimarina]|uniref:PotA_4 protein n=1 Tax=Jannaschia aquimarina TaxID=935700 RepID=A0A0D1CIA3_9RHOB|nr:molybdenum ABC transporter ATP-binding protein [Jannaschia aquimarina]KIT14417.1 Spermidine/putrescine import ATP-binding protein PotA [Jannaschia aquimarina]SNT29681.1 molybdate transport system ATP-binding protein [Jannaschia aquimarina]